MQFGKKADGIDYTERPGAYAVIFNDRQQVAVMKTPRGFFLPGGGMEGEDAQTALKREVLEEAGMEIRIIREIGTASQYILSAGHAQGLHKIGAFFIAAFVNKKCDPCEKDHQLLWLNATEARAQLTHDFQKWAIERAGF